jgi:hypothetical protein
MLLSSSRLDQVQAIDLLLEAKTPEAAQVLLDALQTATDPVLLALLEEALMSSPLDLSPAIQAAFSNMNSPQKLGTLAHLLTQLVRKRPELQQKVVGFFIGALGDAAVVPERADSASKALVALGIGAVDQVATFLTDRATTPEGAGTAAWVLAQLSSEHGDVLRKKLREGLDATQEVLNDPDLPEADKAAVRQKTGSLAWVAMQRPAAEHERIADVLVDSLARTTDEAKAGTLVWGIVNLKGLSDDGRLRATQTLLDSLVGQSNTNLSHTYVRAIGELAASGGTSRPELQRLVENAWATHGRNPQVAVHLQWLRTQLGNR